MSGYGMERYDTDCCGTCKYHKPDNEEEGAWICTNEESYYECEYTDYKDYCADYESRKEY